MSSVSHTADRRAAFPIGGGGVQFFEAIVSAVHQPLLVLDRGMTVVLANRSFHEFLGPEADLLDGAQIFGGGGLWDIAELHARLQQVAEARVSFDDYAFETMRPGIGMRRLSINARPLEIDGDTLILVGLEDVTERGDLERLVRERTSDLEAFNYAVSHDLRAPLRAVDGFARALTEDCADELSAEGERYLGLIRSNTARMGELIDGLLTFSRLGRQGLARRSVDVQRVVREVVEELEPEIAGREIEFVIGDLPPCAADPVLLRQVFANLIGNAVKYTRGCDSARVEIGSFDADGERTWFVADNGVGFDMAYAGKLFQTFQRLHTGDEYEGTGIGLALVRLIVERHGGDISAHAVEGSGATFSFTVPNVVTS